LELKIIDTIKNVIKTMFIIQSKIFIFWHINNNTHNRKPPTILSIGQLENMYQEIKIIEKRNTKIDGICS